MVRKILLFAGTVRHLKLRQVIYQVYNRLKPKHNLSWFMAKIKDLPAPNFLNFELRFEAPSIIKPNNTFTFLNTEHAFGEEINWDYQGNNKLWNYNLQYFNFLHQTDITVEHKKYLIQDITNWLENGRLQLEPYPVALRAMNQVRFFSAQQLNDLELMKSLYAQLAYLNNNFEYHLLGNHLLEDAFALLMGGHFFNNKSWMNNAKAVLYAELDEQILDDGGHFELSPMYHQIIFFRVFELADWYSHVKDSDAAFLEFVRQKAADMLRWLQIINFSNGDIPHLNDSAPGIAFTSSELFAFAARLKITPNNKLQLKASGYRKYALSGYECIVDIGTIAPSYQPGHSHSDSLAFVLYHNNVPVFVEAGTSTYEAGSIRNYERSTAAHNTVTVNNSNQSQVWGAFRVGDRARTHIVNESSNSIEAGHDGYLKNYGCTHIRRFEFETNDIVIIDKVSGNGGKTTNKAYYHLHPDIKLSQLSNDTFELKDVGIIHFNGAVSITTGTYRIANGFNKTLSSTLFEITFADSLKTRIKF